VGFGSNVIWTKQAKEHEGSSETDVSTRTAIPEWAMTQGGYGIMVIRFRMLSSGGQNIDISARSEEKPERRRRMKTYSRRAEARLHPGCQRVWF
jgi:hypothetical protein